MAVSYTHLDVYKRQPLACALYGTEMTNFDLGDYVGVNGCGPIGLMFVRMCVLRGAHVIACDMTPERLALAKKLGAQEIINIKDLNGKDQACLLYTSSSEKSTMRGSIIL